MSKVHIGKKIEEVLKKKGIGATAFAGKINTSRENVYGIFKRKTIDTGMLSVISEVLEHDFFQYFSTQLQDEIKRLKEENHLLKDHIALIKKAK